MKILITGDSHTGALNRGLVALREKQQLDSTVEIRVRPLGGGHLLPTAFFEDANDHAIIVDSSYQKMFMRLPPMTPKYDAMVLSMPLWPMRMVHQFNVEKLVLAANSPGRRPLSYAAFKVMVLEEMKYVLALIDLLQRNGMPVAAVSPPRLFRDHNSLKWQPAPNLLQLWKTYLDIMQAELVARSITVIDIPKDCIDSEGFMLQDYRHEDPKDGHHGNAKLGEVMIQSIETWGNALSKGSAKN